MKINIVLPFFSRLPGGGIKVMYQIANKLVEKGYDVCIYYNLGTSSTYSRFRPFIIRKIVSKVYFGANPRPKWFNLDVRIKSKFIDQVSNETIEDADITLFTWWALASDIQNLNESKGRKFNLIQGYEIWGGPAENVHESYKFNNITNICISDYLKKIVQHYDQKEVESLLLSVDSDSFYVKNNIEDRKNDSVVMLYSNRDHIKGSNFALEAFKKLKQEIPSLEIHLFGVHKREKRIPDWILYHKNPSNIIDIYNSCAIFVSASLTEGWALPPVEAMKCGCAFIGTDISGHETYLKDSHSIKIPPQDSEAIYKAVKLLIENKRLRVRLANNGLEFVKQFTWKNTISDLELIFNEYK